MSINRIRKYDITGTGSRVEPAVAAQYHPEREIAMKMKRRTLLAGTVLLLASPVPHVGEYLGNYIANPYGTGSPYRSNSPNNPFGTGLRVIGE